LEGIAMIPYHKIQTVFKRDPETNHKTLLEGAFSRPEFEYLRQNSWVFTEKVDGTNIRVMFDGNAISFNGKSDNAQMPAPLVRRLQELFLPQLPLFIKEWDVTTLLQDGGVCLYGEGYGGKIQKGGKYRETQDFVLFDVKIGEWWLQRPDVEEIAQKLGLDIVPVIGHGTLLDMVDQVRGGFDSEWGHFPAEGIVARPRTELVARNGQRIITKLKCKDFNAA